MCVFSVMSLTVSFSVVEHYHCAYEVANLTVAQHVDVISAVVSAVAIAGKNVQIFWKHF